MWVSLSEEEKEAIIWKAIATNHQVVQQTVKADEQTKNGYKYRPIIMSRESAAFGCQNTNWFGSAHFGFGLGLD